MSAKTDVIDDLVCNHKLTYEWQSIMDMVSDGGGWKVGTLRNSLYRLRELGLVERKWEGEMSVLGVIFIVWLKRSPFRTARHKPNKPESEGLPLGTVWSRQGRHDGFIGWGRDWLTGAAGKAPLRSATW